MLRGKIGYVVALLLVAMLVVAPSRSTRAQSGLTYTSGIQVQNLSGSTANVQLSFYNEDTGAEVAAARQAAAIPAGGNVTFFPLPGALGSFRGSAVVTADQPIAAITNLLSSDFTYGGSATGLTGGSTTVGLPLIMRGNNGFNTFFSVQNAGSAVATVNVSYAPINAANGNPATEAAFVLQPGASKTFDQSTKAELGARFIGSATITSNQPVAAMVGQVGTGNIRTLLMYDGFGNGSPTVQAPLVMANNAGYFTGLSIQNVGTLATTVTVTYGENTTGGFNHPAQTLTLNPNENGTLLQSGGMWTGQRYVGSATITSSNGQPLVAVINQLKIGTATTSQGTAYEGFNPATVTRTASAPLIMAQNAGYFTGIQCQNAGAATATVTISYSGNTVGGMGTPAADVRVIAPGNSATVLQSGGQWTGRYIGSAVITSDQPIACLVNELKIGEGDTFLTYNAINY